MKNKLTNPFITGGYLEPYYFCDRQKETDILLKAISSKRNITLISLRRMGKTGLLKHVKYNLEHNPKITGRKQKAVAVIYVDLMPTMNGNEMMNTIASALYRLRQDEKSFPEKVLGGLARLRPKISIDSLTGQPAVELKVESLSDLQFGFDHILNFISQIKQNIVFMFDEFQQIGQYPEKNIENLLRTIIQSHPDMPFIFSGSSKHMLESMFSSASRPFYQSAELMYLDKIPAPEYKKFVVEKFESAGRKIDDEDIDRVFTWTRLHTFYVQHVFNLLFETSVKSVDQGLINKAFSRIMSSYEPLFASYRKLIPGHQYRLLQAIAVEDGVAQPTAGAFIKDHSLTTASSVTTSLKALAEKEMIVESDNKWVVYDVFFSRWLQYQYGNR
jgi:uncharacterized protein